MKNYEKPIVTINDDAGEGIYAASGESVDCWIGGINGDQKWSGSYHIFEVWLQHLKEGVEHISAACKIRLTFNYPIKDASSESEFETTFSGNTVTVTRTLHANAYQSGDKVTYKVWVQAADRESTEALACTNVEIIECDKQINVQGGGADEL